MLPVAICESMVKGCAAWTTLFRTVPSRLPFTADADMKTYKIKPVNSHRWRRHIWLMTVNWSPTLVIVGYGRLMSTQCIVPWTNTWLGDRSFAVDGPRFWNTLLAELCQPDIELVTFRRLLKPMCLSVTQVHCIVTSVLIVPNKYPSTNTTTRWLSYWVLCFKCLHQLQTLYKVIHN